MSRRILYVPLRKRLLRNGFRDLGEKFPWDFFRAEARLSTFHNPHHKIIQI